MRIRLLASAALLAASCSRQAPTTSAAPAVALLDQTLELTAVNGALNLPVEANNDLVVTVESTGFDPMLEVVPPGGEALHNDDYQGSRTRSQLTVHTTNAGTMRLAVSSFGANRSGRYRVTVRKVDNAPTNSTFLALGVTQSGEVTNGDRTLPDGRAYDEYMALGPASGSAYELRLTARGQTVPLAVVLDPQGHTVSSTAPGVYPISVPFLHRVQLIQPARGQAAGYSMSLSVASSAPAATPSASPALARDHHAVPANLTGRAVALGGNAQGSLSASSIRLPTGESADVYDLDVTTDRTYSLDAQSSAFDTYLIVLGPDGHMDENDDSSGTDSHLDVRFARAGRAHLIVTSYQSGMSGAYVLKVGNDASSNSVVASSASPATPSTQATGNAMSGELARGDRTLQSGEFVDTFHRSFTRGQPVQVRLSSRDFDPYLIVRSPSGHQSDNDDFAAPDRTAGIDIPSAEEGEYTISVTSYESGEDGRYQLTFGMSGASGSGNAAGGTAANQVRPNVPTTPGTPTVPAANPSRPGEGRLYGVFVGITDYPEGVGDLDECANDAIKLAEALRNHGLLATDRQVVLTNSQATRANVRAAFQRVATQMGPNDTFIFFHSGHGSQIEGSRDTREIDGTDESIYLYDGTIIDDEMGRLFDSLPTRLSILALDSCFAGGFAKDVITRAGRIGLFSSEEDVESSVASQFQAGGYLSYFLRTGVAGDADTGPHDGVLTVGELEHFLIVQFGRHATDVEMAGAYQHLVVDRGAVRSTEQLWRYN